MNAELKAKIKVSMLEHLLSKGYPNMTGDQIIAELQAMWNKLASENLLTDLVRQGFTIQHFANIALQAKHNQDTMDEVAKFFNNRK